MVLLVAMLVVVGGVAALFVLGRSSRPEPEAAEEESAPPLAAASPTDASATVLSEGFDYEQQVAGKPVFRLQGDRFTTDREGKVALEKVHLTLYREGEPYGVSSRRADYDPATQDAQLEGDVRLSGGDGWEIASSRVDLVRNGTVVVSRGGRVDFRRGSGLAGSARRLRFDLKQEKLELDGDVVVSARSESDPQRILGLAAASVEWARDGRRAEATGTVHLTSGSDELRAAQLEIGLDEDGTTPERAVASGDVSGEMQAGESGSLRFTTEVANVTFASGAPAVVDLSASSPHASSELEMRQSGEPQRTMVAPNVRLALKDGKPAEVEATGGVELQERAGGSEGRRAKAQKLAASFDGAGQLSTARLDGNVSLIGDGWTVTGTQAVVRDAGDRSTVTGEPARAQGLRGDLRAPELEISRAESRLEARGGVHARFRPEEGPLATAGGATGDQPVDVEAAQATFVESPRKYEFRDGVQAAQGDSLLFADKLSGDDLSTTATGKVRTLWTDRSAVASGGSAVVTTITSDNLEYRKGDGSARYSGAVKVRQEKVELSADEITVEVEAGRRARRLLASGSARIYDRGSERTVTGDSADYDLTEGTAVVVGEPAVIREKGGVTLRGRRALFDRATGSARLVSETP